MPEVWCETSSGGASLLGLAVLTTAESYDPRLYRHGCQQGKSAPATYGSLLAPHTPVGAGILQCAGALHHRGEYGSVRSLLCLLLLSRVDVEELGREGVGTRGPEIAIYFLQEAVCNGPIGRGQ